MKTILIIDDEEVLLNSLKEHLEYSGFAVVTASDGIQGIKKSQYQRFDMIICDISMPKMDGLRTIENIKNSGVNMKTPIITISAHFDGRAVASLRGKIIKGFVKPFLLEDLTKFIHENLNQRLL